VSRCGPAPRARESVGRIRRGDRGVVREQSCDCGAGFGLRFGELRAGCVGDLAIFDYDPPTPLERANALGHAVFGLSQATVDTTIASGRVLMATRRLELNLDEERVNARAREQAKDLWQRL